MTDWFEDDAFWAELEPFLFSYVRTDERTTGEVDRMLELLQLQDGAPYDQNAKRLIAVATT